MLLTFCGCAFNVVPVIPLVPESLLAVVTALCSRPRAGIRLLRLPLWSSGLESLNGSSLGRLLLLSLSPGAEVISEFLPAVKPFKVAERGMFMLPNSTLSARCLAVG